MDLALSEALESLRRRVKVELPQEGPFLPWPTTAMEQVIMGGECGRAAAPLAWHGALLAHLLGWRGDTRATGAIATGAGRADVVAGGANAQAFLIAVSEDRILQFSASEVERIPKPVIDDPESCTVLFVEGKGVSRPASVRVAKSRAALVRAADALGAAEAAFDFAVNHVRHRIVRGAPLSRFQSVRHRCADMKTDLVMARDAVLAAATTSDRVGAEQEALVAISLAKVAATDRAVRVTAAAHQLCGGPGILADCPLHLWFRRARGAELSLGDNRRHLEVIASSVLGPLGEPSSGDGSNR